MKTKDPTPNEKKSIVKNPNNPAFEADIKNRVKLGHITPQEATEIKERKKTN
jgi:hypothetical protein